MSAPSSPAVGTSVPIADTMCAAFQRTAARFPDGVALRTPGSTMTVTWQRYAEEVRRIAAGLAGLGVRRGDTVALMLTNRPEFHLVDTAALHAGATPFSMYQTLAVEQLAYVLRDSGARVVVCERRFADVLRAATPGTDVAHLVCVDGRPEGMTELADLEPDPDFDFTESWRAVRPDDVLTVIYTSGTTGPPKGVELTHANMAAEVAATLDVLPVTQEDRVVSYLPDAHVANRWGAHYLSLHTGMQITTVADAKAMIAALPDVRPTFFGAVPQVWYKLKAAIEGALAAERSPVKRRLAAWAVDVGGRTVRLGSAGQPVPAALRQPQRHRLADRLVLAKVRATLGLDQVRVAASGAAPIAPEALEFVLALGIPVCELWGMSETSAAATMNPPDAIRIGTVGRPVRGVELRLAEDGELLVRGPLVMKGYRNDPVRTAEAIDPEGWLHTGDIATIDDDGYVRIIDRKKELIINAAGKNMSPTAIENAVKVACPLAGSVAAIGDDRPYVVALVTLDPDAAAVHAAEHGLVDRSPAALAADPGVRTRVAEGIRAANEKLSRVEQVKKFAILPTLWEPGGDELTPTMKLRRAPVARKYADVIDQLYAE
ncbi:Long-chain acyl-CoA synthetase (AMP-forming) [Amycolatopsis arida]|uniref:Acyl-CoA synthetase n=1 Tax=Amycolatopsis arida TaxID=587909 RepID=A0A1I5ZSR9_9PSEU|nr:AMP-dependent synthetase/ligase [Amycolatopsis arida]TDX89329.1 long-subunit acyl-CoA synthetase (AMP-forming) [Amycolatopsis arida]SFQ59237.1 Long-chain acyl-CoA synthetase (AMP-forming) [Amycolatopsis arida]